MNSAKGATRIKRRRQERRAGFSLLEALVVLAISSLTLALIFSVGARSTRLGFRLGQRALTVADSQVGAQSARAVLRGLLIPAPQPGGRLAPDFDGSAQGLSAAASLPRPTPCAGIGPAGQVRLSLDQQKDGWRLICLTQGGGSAVLLALGTVRPVFSYSLDGRPWTDRVHLSGVPRPPLPGAVTPPAPLRRLMVRLSTPDGAVDLVEALSSGRPTGGQAAA